jgi:hypothetical protein
MDNVPIGWTTSWERERETQKLSLDNSQKKL